MAQIRRVIVTSSCRLIRDVISHKKTRWQPPTKNMPTSSQAMILRGSDEAKVNYSCISPDIYSQGFKSVSARGAQVSQEKTHIQKVNCELVKFDFSVSTQKQQSLNSFEGVFAYDPTTKSYRWQICSTSISPKNRCDVKVNKRYESGDYADNENDDTCPTERFEQCRENLGPDLFIDEETSELTQHFTTPAVSCLDNSKSGINPKTYLHGHGCPQPMAPINFPTQSEQQGDVSYRRLEELGFRRRTGHNSSGNLIRMKNVRSPTRSATKCPTGMSSVCRDSVARLTINTMDPMGVPTPNKIPYKRQGFSPTSFVSGDCMRKRVRPKPKKSLLDEVKETVGWKHRVTPSMYLRRGQLTSSPTTVCFSLREGHQFCHSDVKQLVQTQLGCDVRSLQYDPVSVRTSESGMYDRWIMTLNNRDDFSRAIHTGLAVNGDKVVVKAWDDVVRSETLVDSHEPPADWDYPCSYRLQQEKHDIVLRNFLAVNSPALGPD